MYILKESAIIVSKNICIVLNNTLSFYLPGLPYFTHNVVTHDLTVEDYISDNGKYGKNK